MIRQQEAIFDEAIRASIDKLLATQMRQARRDYDQSLNRDLAQQQTQAMLLRNISLVLTRCFEEALTTLTPLSSSLDTTAHAQLVTYLDKKYETLINELLLYVLDRHRSSCAISNFPEEHAPSQAYLAEVGAQIQHDWQQFIQTLT